MFGRRRVGHSKVSLGDKERRKTQKSRGEEKVMSFGSDSLFPTRKWEAVTQSGTRRIDHTTRKT